MPCVPKARRVRGSSSRLVVSGVPGSSEMVGVRSRVVPSRGCSSPSLLPGRIVGAYPHAPARVAATAHALADVAEMSNDVPMLRRDPRAMFTSHTHAEFVTSPQRNIPNPFIMHTATECTRILSAA